ncbi:alginate lyase family protein [Dyadobacter psychrotolerans]|uniref:Alginate lyase domain-containing protein n=1 Tax=Dyadobacter psychrotolerans TaxID=2541721 RepID=A0A4R5DAY3_9BACT|nr:alginate lyase family protein [Dyadobacter psychrotolerans]TDE10832.1 hypothetical protein E0F88_27550 [Dyadobacter psychrotolerans]
MTRFKSLLFTLLLTFLFCHTKAQNQPKFLSTQKLAPALKAPQAVKQLMADAELAMKVKAYSVTDNAALSPAGDKHDYYSWAPYMWPNPDTKSGYPYINRDGRTNPQTEARSDKPLLRRMSVAVNTLALAYAYSKDVKYAQRAVTLIRTWFLDPNTKMNPNMNFAQCTPGIEKGAPIGIIDSRWLTLVIDADDILSSAGMISQTDHKQLQNWFKGYLDWLLTSKLGRSEAAADNNHGSWCAVQIARYALFTGNETIAKETVNASRRFFDIQIDSLGRQKLELKRTKSFDYSLYNLHALIALAQIGDLTGIDLWHYNAGGKKNILESIKFMAGYADDKNPWPFQQIAPKAISLGYEDYDHFSVYYPYDLCSALRIGVNVYQDKSVLKVLESLPKESAQANRAALLYPVE